MLSVLGSSIVAILNFADCVSEDVRVLEVCAFFISLYPVEIEIEITLSTSDGTGMMVCCIHINS